MSELIISGSLVPRVSKDNNPYTALELTFSNGYKKFVLVTHAEILLLNSLL